MDRSRNCSFALACILAATGVLGTASAQSAAVLAEQEISETEGAFGGDLDPGDVFGKALAPLGDLNGDGIVDLAASAHFDDDGGSGPNANHGSVWILFLNADGTVAAEQKISETEGGFGGDLDTNDFFGFSLAPLGDLDGDGVIDLAVGASSDDDGGTDRGSVWILFLNTDGTVASEQKISATEGGFGGTLTNNGLFGHSVAALGDLDGDGITELAVGNDADDDGGNGQGAVWILFLNADGTVASEQKISATHGGFGGDLDVLDRFGISVAGLGDLDGDGFGDLAVGAFRDDDGDMDQGAVWILFLNADGTVASEQKISATAGGFGGDLDESDEFGFALGALGDLDGDGIGDLAVGAHLDGGADQGAVWILFLNADGTVAGEQKISATAGGFGGALLPQDAFGASAVALGDLDGDGITELAAGAWRSDDGGTDQGSVWILFLGGILPGDVLFVRADATGAEDGTSWHDAHADLQDALAAVQPGDEIWVAAGTYLPSASGDRDASFALASGVALYGGFAGTEALREERDPALNPTILSGALPASEGSYHVVVASGTNLTARLDGFRIVEGQANGSGDRRSGAGLFAVSASPTLVQCTFEDNLGSNGAVHVRWGAPVLAECTIRSNTGGGLQVTGNATLRDCVIEANQGFGARLDGVGSMVGCDVLDNSSIGVLASNSLTVLDSRIERNQGGGMTAAATTRLTGVSFVDNQRSSDGGGLYARNADLVVTVCLFEGNTAGRHGGGAYISDVNASFNRSSFRENTASSGGGLYIEDRDTIFASDEPNPAFLRNCLFSGSTGSALEIHGGDTSSPGGVFRVYKTTFSGNPGRAVLHAKGSTVLSGCIVWDSGSQPIRRQWGTLIVSNSIVQGGYTGGNSGANPQFVSPATGDFRSSFGSPAIDSSASSGLLAAGPADLDGNQRAHDELSTPNTGSGGGFGDRGAYEYGSPPACVADCDGDGICDEDEIAGGAGDLNADGIPDPCQGVASAGGVDLGETVTLFPDGSGSLTTKPRIEFENVSSATPGSITAVLSEIELHPGASGYGAFGRTLTIETDLPDGAFFLRVTLPFTAADLGGANPLSSDLLYYDAPAFGWALAASGNTLPSPMHPGPLGDRFPVQSASPPTLSADLGDYGVYWHPTQSSGFVWANVDHTTDFRGGLAFGVMLDCNQNDVPDETDIATAASLDCNENGMPDECELAYGWAADCDGDGTLDECQLTAGLVEDCNQNGIPDACDIASGTSRDEYLQDGIPDECQFKIQRR